MIVTESPPNEEIALPDGSQLKAIVTKEYFEKLSICFDVEEDPQKLPSVFREVPLLKTSTENNEKYFLDLVIFLNKPIPIFIGIEGKVFDKSVRRDQLKNYYRSIKSFLPKKDQFSQNCSIQLFLLSTYRNNNGSDSKALKKIKKFNRNTSGYR